MKQVRDALQDLDRHLEPCQEDGRDHSRPSDGGGATPLAEAKAFLIEIDGLDVGLAVPERGGFRFVAASPRFSPLEGSRFQRLGQLEAAAERLVRRAAEGKLRYGA